MHKDSVHLLSLQPASITSSGAFKPECNGLSQFREDTGKPSGPVREFNLSMPASLIEPKKPFQTWIGTQAGESHQPVSPAGTVASLVVLANYATRTDPPPQWGEGRSLITTLKSLDYNVVMTFRFNNNNNNNGFTYSSSNVTVNVREHWKTAGGNPHYFQWRRQRSKVARSFRGHNILKPGHPESWA